MSALAPLTEAERQKYMAITEENLEFLWRRYNKVNRWVIADMVRRSAYRYPDKPALISGDRAVVVLKAGCTATEDEIIALCREHLAPFKVPKGVLFIDQLPKTPSGKILKRDLRLIYRDYFQK